MRIELTKRELGLAILALNVATAEQASKAVEAFLDGNEARHNELLNCCAQCSKLAERFEQAIAEEFKKEASE